MEERSAHHRDLYTKTHNIHKGHTSSGIQKSNPSKQAAADPRLRPHGHFTYTPNISMYLVLYRFLYDTFTHFLSVFKLLCKKLF